MVTVTLLVFIREMSTPGACNGTCTIIGGKRCLDTILIHNPSKVIKQCFTLSKPRGLKVAKEDQKADRHDGC